MRPSDAFGIALLGILAFWIATGNLKRNAAGATLLRVDHPRKVSFLIIALGLAIGVGISAIDGPVRIPWLLVPLALFQIAVRKVELREEGVFANPSFYRWEDVAWAGWSENTLILKSAKRFVSPRVLRLPLEGEDLETARRVIDEKVPNRWEKP